MSEEIASIKKFFQTNHIVLPTDWLVGCVEWLKEDKNGSHYPTKDLHSDVYEQWLLLDFKEVNMPVLPRNITQEKKLVLRESICLQLMSIVDISKPKLFQIQKIRNSAMLANNTEEAVNGKRVLQLLLTDGVQDILATEYQPIACLNLNLTPGLKVRLNGPIIIRRGQIMLDPGRISILGGEVEKLLVSNASENVLAAFLGLAINPNPVVMEANFENAENVVIERTNQANRNINQPTTRPRPTIDISEEEELRLAAEMDIPMEIESNINKRVTTPDLFHDSTLNEENFVATTTSTAKKSVPAKVNVVKSRFEEEFDADEYDELMRIEEEVTNAPPKLVSNANISIMSLERLNNMKGSVTKGIFKIHARFKSVAQKLSITDDSFSIKIVLVDDSDEMTVALHSDVISYILEYEPRALMALKTSESRDPTMVAKAMKAMNGFREKLLELNCKMEVLLEASREVPVVTKLL